MLIKVYVYKLQQFFFLQVLPSLKRLAIMTSIMRTFEILARNRLVQLHLYQARKLFNQEIRLLPRFLLPRIFPGISNYRKWYLSLLTAWPKYCSSFFDYINDYFFIFVKISSFLICSIQLTFSMSQNASSLSIIFFFSVQGSAPSN